MNACIKFPKFISLTCIKGYILKKKDNVVHKFVFKGYIFQSPNIKTYNWSIKHKMDLVKKKNIKWN